MAVAADTNSSPRKTLAVCGGAHALHDGFTDLLNVLYPLLQAQFGLSYAAIGALKTVYSGAMASGQIPSGWLAGKLGGVYVLAGGTALIAVGYGLAGLTGSLYGVIVGLLLAGLGGATQHPIASTLVAGAFPAQRSRAALGTYNFTGDVGKVALPAVFALVAAAMGWRQAMLVTAAIAVVGAGLIFLTLQPAEMAAKAKDGKAIEGQDRPWAFWLLFAIHVADSAVRSGFLIFLPFLLQAKGADLPTIGLALSLLFAGGAAGKLVIGWLGARLGVVRSVVLTEMATTALILALLPLSLTPALALLPAVGVMLNGTSSVLYGTIPEFVTVERRTHAFAVFYTGGSVAGAAAPFLFGLLGDHIGLSPALIGVGALALLTVPLVAALRPAFRSTQVPSA
ncbi:MAG: MFS transporter [Reyranella sp.]|uniref:MFS transporter n=1 Tax=Reyranella sp. TaxID=1929291 RepID=UPI001AC27E80|nr:MFS transporter [Reyranella sp.]MBN9088458.1 MFS transporter [Reyranella sp.]